MEAAASRNFLVIDDAFGEAVNACIPSGYVGFTLSEGITDFLRIETGALVKQNLAGYYLELPASIFDYNHETSRYLTLQVPLRIQLRQPIVRDRFSLFTTVGYHYSFNLEGSGTRGGRGTIGDMSGGYLVTSESVSSRVPDTGFSLLEAGMGCILKFPYDGELYITSSYFAGFKEMVHTEFTYTLGNDPVREATASDMGEYWCLSVGYRHPFRLGGEPVRY